ncbi:hypothetical protein [Flavobacterium aestivum]|uniref:hypothetical protein n=1 Tax=Flavobacterium aestivum TaxID=3003257 RepID=UPI002482866C|nr:hypothetical protein [Flavobacterium aestivum]
MKQNTYINASDFIESLQSMGLIIVSAREFEASKDLDRKRMMRKKALSLKEIVDFKLLPLKSKKGVESWISRGKIKSDEIFQEQTGQKRIMVLTSAIKRLGYGD